MLVPDEMIQGEQYHSSVEQPIRDFFLFSGDDDHLFPPARTNGKKEQIRKATHRFVDVDAVRGDEELRSSVDVADWHDASDVSFLHTDPCEHT